MYIYFIYFYQQNNKFYSILMLINKKMSNVELLYSFLSINTKKLYIIFDLRMDYIILYIYHIYISSIHNHLMVVISVGCGAVNTPMFGCL